MNGNQQRAAELWAELNIAGLDGDFPDAATTARVASAYRAALNAAEARGRAEALREAADIPLKACCPEHASKRIRALANKAAR